MPDGVLGAIVERKRSDVAVRLAGTAYDPEPSGRSLRRALGQPGARFIMEVKKASPSGHRSSVSAQAAAAAYAPVADAISVLTDEPFFGGSLNDLVAVRAMFDGPILAKDFIVDPRQVAEARAHGADAVLAIMAVLSDAEAAALFSEAGRLSMDVIAEVHDERELQRALALGVAIIGINNRDLLSLRTDLSTTERLAPLVPGDRIVIAESGIATRKDVERLAPLVDAFLVGSSLMAAADVALAARNLVFGPVKICGLTNDVDLRNAAEAGATHAGFIFVPDTPRYVAADAAGELVEAAREAGLHAVGVFRGQASGAVVMTAKALELDAVQVDGDQCDPAVVRDLLPAGREVWSVCAVSDTVQRARNGADRTVFDSQLANLCGGTGRSFDWSRIAGRADLASAFLAGGIRPENAAAAARLGAFGLDVGSGVEAAPGRKDPSRLAELFAALRPGCRRSVQCA